MFSLILLSAIAPPAFPAQGPVPQEEKRLAEDQARLAPQLRRLEKLFALLEERAESDGNQHRMQLLKNARLQLMSAELDGRTLPEQIEQIAIDLAEQRTGPALEAQQELLKLLESMLNELLEQELQQRLETALEQALTKAAKLQQAAELQKEILAMTLETEAKSENQSGDLKLDIENILQRQAELNQKLAEILNQELSDSENSQLLKEAIDAAKKAEENLEQATQGDPKSEDRKEQLKNAEEHQQEAVKKLDQASQNAGEQADRMAQQQKQEALLNLMAEAEALLERHQACQTEMKLFLSEHGSGRVPRTARVQLRKLSSEQNSLSSDAQLVLDDIDTGGADTTPYLMRSIISDHHRLSGKLGPPSYRCRESQIALAEDISEAWTEIIEAIRAEAEREREKIEGQGQGGGNGQQQTSLVSFSEELQLLKRLQDNLNQRLAGFSERRRILNENNIEFDDDDLEELDRLLQKQAELRQVYEAILERLESSSQPAQEPDSSDDEELF